MNTDEDLVARAMSGDHHAFERLTAPLRPQIRAVVKRMVGHPEDTEDIIQDSMLKAWNGIGGFKQRSSFSTWLISIAARTALDFLRRQKRWRGEAQVAYANLCAGSEELSGEVVSQCASPDFSYEVREHVSYCFSCVGRSLPPDEIAVLVLRDIVDMSAREASNALGLSESVMRHRLATARTSMQEQYEGLCALVSKTGICHQCKGLQMVAPEDKKGGPFPDVQSFADRCAAVRNCKSTSMEALHDIFWRRTKEIEEQGLGTIEAESLCGIDDDETETPAPAQTLSSRTHG